MHTITSSVHAFIKLCIICTAYKREGKSIRRFDGERCNGHYKLIIQYHYHSETNWQIRMAPHRRHNVQQKALPVT